MNRILSPDLKPGRELSCIWRVDIDMLGLERMHNKENSLYIILTGSKT
jgi:hypothetical protein